MWISSITDVLTEQLSNCIPFSSRGESAINSIRERLDNTFIRKISSAMILMHSSSTEAKRYLIAALSMYRKIDVDQFICLIDSEDFQTDHDALIEISNQFLVRRQNDKDLNAALEDLEQVFRQCYIDGNPAIVILDNFHNYAKKRQTLVYTLLDMLHKSDALFTMIGITSRSDIHVDLEKRVQSRLGAQYVTLPYLTTTHICYEFSKRLKLIDIPGGLIEDKEEYIRRHNNSIVTLLGKFRDRDPIIGREDLEATGALHGFIETLLNWGKTYSFFEVLFQRAVASLTTQQPLLSEQLIYEVCRDMLPQPLSQVLQQLTQYELTIYAAIARYHCQRTILFPNQNANSESSKDPSNQLIHTQKSGALSLSSLFAASVNDIVVDFDKITDALTKQIVSIERINQCFLKLAESSLIKIWSTTLGKVILPYSVTNLLEPSCLLYVNHSAEEISQAFSTQRSNSHDFLTKYFEGPLLKMPEKLRRVVLEPLKPLHYETNGASL